MNTEELLNILPYYHLQEFLSGGELTQVFQEDDYGRNIVASAGGIKHSTFFDTVNECGVEQLLAVFTELQKQATGILPSQYLELGEINRAKKETIKAPYIVKETTCNSLTGHY